MFSRQVGIEYVHFATQFFFTFRGRFEVKPQFSSALLKVIFPQFLLDVKLKLSGKVNTVKFTEIFFDVAQVFVLPYLSRQRKKQTMEYSKNLFFKKKIFVFFLHVLTPGRDDVGEEKETEVVLCILTFFFPSLEYKEFFFWTISY